MPDRTVTTSTGTTITLTRCDSDTLVILDHPGAPADMRNLEAGRVLEGVFQPAPFVPWGLTPTTLRAIAGLIDGGAPAAPGFTRARVIEMLGDAWDDGNATGLDGWTGPGRGTEPVDSQAIYSRNRSIRNLIEAETADE